jgi:aryl-alcohol dehydrogenase-like predicted oxidoreductase
MEEYEMKHVDIGGHKISKMTLGTVQLGMNYGLANTTGKPSLEKAFELLDVAVAGGVNSFDTANGYGDSEDVLGKYFSRPECKLKDPFFTTKFSVDPKTAADSAAIEKQIYGFAELSLKRLHINRIPVYMLHNPKDMSQFGDVVPKTLKKLKRDGLIERAGVSVYNPSEVEEMLSCDLYEATQMPMNAFDSKMVQTGVLKKLADKGCTVFVRSVFLQGLFFMDPHNIPESIASTGIYLRRFHEIAMEENLSIAQLALAFIRDMPGVTSVVLGSETPEQVSDNLKIVECPILAPKTYAKLEKLSVEVPIDIIMQELHNRYRR